MTVDAVRIVEDEVRSLVRRRIAAGNFRYFDPDVLRRVQTQLLHQSHGGVQAGGTHGVVVPKVVLEQLGMPIDTGGVHGAFTVCCRAHTPIRSLTTPRRAAYCTVTEKLGQ